MGGTNTAIRNIDRPIVGFRVARPTDPAVPKTAAPSVSAAAAANDASIERPEVLVGSTYKIKTPVSDHAMYVTINDIPLDGGTQRRPYEIFVNTKNLDQYAWVVGLTRVLSAVFRQGGDIAFMIEELKAVHDPKGGYWKPGGKYMPSTIAELGYVIEAHLQEIGFMKKPELDPARQRHIAEVQAQLDAQNRQQDAFANPGHTGGRGLCGKCNTAGVVNMDGCQTCLNCADSKCS